MSNLFGFTGEPSDPSGDLLYLRARFYHPALGRFLTPDSLIPDPLNSQDWNRYAYVRNDPLNLVDPSGHWATVARAGVRIALTVAVGAGLAAWADQYMNADRAHQQWWHTVPTCDCAPPGPTPLNIVLLGLAPGVANSAANAMGLADDVTRKAVPGSYNPATQAHIDYVTEMAEAGSQAHQAYLDKLIKSRAVRVNGTPKFGIGEGVNGPAGMLRLNADGVALGGGFLDATLQLFFDRDVCYSPRQKFRRALIAAGLGMAAAGIGTAVSARFTTGAGFGASTVVAFGNEVVVKPIVFQGLKLQ